MGNQLCSVSVSCKSSFLPLSRIQVSHVLNDTHMKFSLPSSRKEMKDVCIQFDGGNCSPVGALSYIALPHCSFIFPATTWIRYRLDHDVCLLLLTGHMPRDRGCHANAFRNSGHILIPLTESLLGFTLRNSHTWQSGCSHCHMSALSTSCCSLSHGCQETHSSNVCGTTVTILSLGFCYRSVTFFMMCHSCS